MKRRGPLLWIGDFARHRPALAVVLALLFAVLALLSVGLTVRLQRQQRLRQAQEDWRRQQQQQQSLLVNPRAPTDSNQTD